MTPKSSGRPARRFADFRWTTRESWSRRRRVVAKAEWMPGRGAKGANPRFVVTSLKAARADARTLYEQMYCARGEMENRIKECQLDLFADRTSAATLRANQLRLWFASMAYVLVTALRRLALAGTELATATCGSIRLKLLKIGALVTRSVRRIRVAMASSCPDAAAFRHRPRPIMRLIRNRPDPPFNATKQPHPDRAEGAGAQPYRFAAKHPHASMNPVQVGLHEGPGEKCGLSGPHRPISAPFLRCSGAPVRSQMMRPPVLDRPPVIQTPW